jgi:hypothetical protein
MQDLLGTWSADPSPTQQFTFVALAGHPGEVTTTDFGGEGTVGADRTELDGVNGGSGSLVLTYDFASDPDYITIDDGSSAYQATRS